MYTMSHGTAVKTRHPLNTNFSNAFHPAILPDPRHPNDISKLRGCVSKQAVLGSSRGRTIPHMLFPKVSIVNVNVNDNLITS